MKMNRRELLKNAGLASGARLTHNGKRGSSKNQKRNTIERPHRSN